MVLPGEAGFIHCTRQPEVLLEVANRFYRDRPGDFVVLVIDPARLRAPVRDEPPAHPAPVASLGTTVLFPHIYGPLNREAVVEVRAAERNADGTFVRV